MIAPSASIFRSPKLRAEKVLRSSPHFLSLALYYFSSALPLLCSLFFVARLLRHPPLGLIFLGMTFHAFVISAHRVMSVLLWRGLKLFASTEGLHTKHDVIT